MDSSRYLLQVHNTPLQRGETNWAKDVQNILCRNSLEQVWREQSLRNVSGFLRDFRGHFIVDFEQKWSLNLEKSMHYRFL